MRTTLTLDDDLALLLQNEARRTGQSFKETVNSLIRQGLVAQKAPRPPEKFRVTPYVLHTGLGSLHRKTDEVLDAFDAQGGEDRL